MRSGFPVHNTYTTIRRLTIAVHAQHAQPVRCMSLNLLSNANSNCNRHPYDDRMRDVYQKIYREYLMLAVARPEPAVRKGPSCCFRAKLLRVLVRMRCFASTPVQDALTFAHDSLFPSVPERDFQDL